MNKYSNDPEEVERITRIIKAGLTIHEARYFFRGFDAWQLANTLGMNTRRKTEAEVISYIYAHVFAPPKEDNPAPVKNPTPPKKDAPSKPAQPKDIDSTDKSDEIVEPVECDGCGGVSKLTGLRWDKVAKGEAVTYSIAPLSARTPLAKLLKDADLKLEDVIAGAFGVWAAEADIKFKKVRKGDIHFTFDNLEDSTLGFAYQPASGELMENGGDLSGDITIDHTRRWVLWLLILTLIHEIGHGIGIPHSKNPADIMYFRPASAGNRKLGPGDIKEVAARYNARKTKAA